MRLFNGEINLKIFPKQWLIKNTIPTGGISVIYGDYADINTYVTTELVLSAANGKHWHGNKVSSAQQVLFITAECMNKVARRVKVWKETNQISEKKSLLSVLCDPIDLLNKHQFLGLVEDVSYLNLSKGRDEFPALVVFDLQGGLTSEVSPYSLLQSINILRRQMGSAFLLVFNEGSCSGCGECDPCDSFNALFNAADAVHRVTAIDDDLGARLSCTKMRDFAKPDDVYFELSCVESSQTGEL